MSGNGGYAIIRVGVLDHLLSGRLGLFELGIYAAIHLQADFRTGVWWGSAPRLLASAPRGTSLRRIQEGLDRLREIGFLRPFHVPGRRGNYRVFVDKYDVKLGALSGKRLNAWKSETWKSPVYEERNPGRADGSADARADGAPIQDSEGRSQETKPTSRRSAPAGVAPSDDGFVAFYAAYPKRRARRDAEAAWATLGLDERAAAMAGVERWKCSQDWAKDAGRFIPYPANFLRLRRWEDEIPAPSIFCGGIEGVGKGEREGIAQRGCPSSEARVGHGPESQRSEEGERADRERTMSKYADMPEARVPPALRWAVERWKARRRAS